MQCHLGPWGLSMAPSRIEAAKAERLMQKSDRLRQRACERTKCSPWTGRASRMSDDYKVSNIHHYRGTIWGTG